MPNHHLCFADKEGVSACSEIDTGRLWGKATTARWIKKKNRNQDAFINGDVGIMVATSAFGMGVDKKDVGMVIHYEISDSLKIIYRKPDAQAGMKR